MSFTDEDLKRWNKYYEGSKQPGNQHIDLRLSDMRALLARLEAAEKVCQITNRIFVPLGNAEEVELALIAWRKSAGKT